MGTKNLEPESFSDLKKHSFKHTWIWIAGKPLWIKAVALVCVLAVLLLGARVNIFGEPYYDYTKRIFPMKLCIDPPIPVIGLQFWYDLEDEMNRRPGKHGQTVFSGNIIHWTVKSDTNCWLSVIGVDSKGVHPVFRDKYDPTFIQKGEHSDEFCLDKTVGNEIYYAIAAHDAFSFEKDIRPNLQRVFKEGSSKGPTPLKFKLGLPEKYTQALIYFYHERHNM